MAQCMTHLAHKHGGGSLDLQDPGKSCPVLAATREFQPSGGRGRAGQACYLDQLELVSARSRERSCLQTLSRKQWEKIPSVNFWPLHVCTQMCMCTHVHPHTCEHSYVHVTYAYMCRKKRIMCINQTQPYITIITTAQNVEEEGLQV